MSKSVTEYRAWAKCASINELKLAKIDRIEWIKCLVRLLDECPTEPAILKEMEEASDVVNILVKEIARRIGQLSDKCGRMKS